MKITVTVGHLLFAICVGSATAAKVPDPLCLPMRQFVASVEPGEVHELAFHTSWGSHFNSEKESAIFAKKCLHRGYGPARPACQALMEHGALEFSNTNAERVVTCLAPSNRWGEHVHLEQGSLSLEYGTDSRGANVIVSYGVDKQMGGMVLRVRVSGY